jgi:CDP-diacylglycerol--glycerol-3-phosphate 3-phosphatidyltransferase
MFFLFSRGVFAKALALACFIAASLTDYYDGRIARKTGQITTFGKLMDPVADKVLMLAAFLAFVELELVPAWMVVIIIMRELFITGVRLVAVGRGVVLAAETGGKHKTISQVVAVFSMLVFLLAKEAASSVWNPTFELWFRRVIFYMMLVVVGLTLTSAISFLKRNEKLLK